MSILVQAGSVRVGDAFPPERDLSQDYGVSIAVVREAFRILEHAGLVEVKQGGRRYLVSEAPVFGSLLTGVEQVAQKDLLEARRLVESPIIRLAAERRTEADLQRLRAMAVQVQGQAADLQRSHDIEFHLAIAEAAQNPVLKRLQDYVNQLRAARRAFTMSPDVRQTLSRDHQVILGAIESSNPDAATEALMAHLDRAQAAFEDAPEFENQPVD